MRTLLRFACLLASMSLAMGSWAESTLSLASSFTSTGSKDSTLSLVEAMSMATQNQPLLQSLDYATASAREAAIASGQLPDPRIKVGVVNLPITGSDTGRFNRDEMTMSTIGVMQEMVPSSKRDAAARLMEATAGQYQAEKTATTLSIQREVALAWLDVYEAQRKTELYERITQEMKAERTVMTSRISTGGTQLSEVLKLDSELSMINDKRLTVVRNERKARAALLRWIGPAANKALAPELPIMAHAMDQSNIGSMLDEHPVLRNAQEMETVAQSDAEAAKANRALNWNWELMYGKRRADLSDMVTFQVAMDLPWDRPNRQDRRTAEKILLAEKAHSLTEDRRRELAAQFADASSEVETAKARESEHQERLIPTAQARLDIAQAGYQAGKQSLSEVWQARRNVLEVEMEHWSIMTDMARASVAMDYLMYGALFKGAQR